MELQSAKILEHSQFSGEYMLLALSCPSVSASARPGQFIHLRVPDLEDAVLRRPFSIFQADEDKLSILYKVVGRGTKTMTALASGEELSIIGPLGNGFPAIQDGGYPVLVAGGYGVAPLCFLAKRMEAKGVIFIGGATSSDILCADYFRELGWEVVITTDDGTLGEQGLVTKSLDSWLASDATGRTLEFYACGPDGMLKALGDRAVVAGQKAWLSLDKHMGCAVGACLACVQKIKVGDAVEWKRVCKDGPIFEAAEIVWS